MGTMTRGVPTVSGLTSEQKERLASRSVHRQDPFDEVDLPELPAVPGMVSLPDMRYMYWLTSRGYTGSGAVVEVGTWLGRSTIHLAAGLRDAGYRDVLYCFDRYEWANDHMGKARLPLRPGDDFHPYFERNVQPVYPELRSFKVDIDAMTWTGGPVEILVLDAPKRLPQISSILAVFGPHLIPGISVIVLQDYVHFPSYPLAAVMSRLADRLELIHVNCTTTATMAVRAPLDLDHAQPLDWNFHHWSLEEALEQWRKIMEPLNPQSREDLAPGLTMLLYDAGHTEAACQLARDSKWTALQRQRWLRFRKTTLYDRYEPVFRAAGYKRISRRPSGGRKKRTSRPVRLRRMARLAWRKPYLKSRSIARRVLERVGFLQAREQR